MRDDHYIHHNDYDQPKNNKHLSNHLYEKTKSKIKRQEEENRAEPMK